MTLFFTNVHVEFSQLGAGAAADIVALNAGAAIYVAGLSADLSTGVALAKQKLISGEAAQTLQQLVSFTQQ